MIVLPLPIAWSLALENLLRPIHVRRLGWSAPTVYMVVQGALSIMDGAYTDMTAELQRK